MTASVAFLIQVCFASSVANTLLHTHAGAAIVAARRTRRLRRTRSFPPSFSRRASPVGTARIAATSSNNSTHRRGRSQYLFSRRFRQSCSSASRRHSRTSSTSLPSSPIPARLSAATAVITSPSDRSINYFEAITAGNIPSSNRPCTPPDKTILPAAVLRTTPLPQRLAPAPVPAPVPAPTSVAQVLSSTATTNEIQPSAKPTSTPLGSLSMSMTGCNGSCNGGRNCPSEPRQSTDSLTRPLSRSASSASRNRLSLTLPIAPPTSHSSRPTPTSTVHTSFPSTPADVPSCLASTPDSCVDLVHAIAAQERRVLELKEELKHAEHELKKLRRQFLQADKSANKASHPLRHHGIIPLSAGLADPGSTDDAFAQRRSVELDRRRAVLAAHQQHGQQSDGKKKVFRGHHARALSLISPPSSASSEFDEMDDGQDSVSTTSAATAPVNSTAGRSNLHHRNNPMLTKRATWNINPARNTPTGIKQFADDFRVGLWTFVEDIRQATVGEEAANRQAVRSPNVPALRPARSTAVEADGGDTIRASTAARPNASALFDQSESAQTPQKSSGGAAQGPKMNRQDSKNKRFSWTPLTEDLNDEDWSNWDSPTIGVPSPRWSGSTVSNGEASAAASTIPNREMDATPSKLPNASLNRNSLQILKGATGLEELPWQAIHKLSPSNLKRTATNLMDQWEKSLAAPGEDATTAASPTGGVDSALAYPATAA